MKSLKIMVLGVLITATLTGCTRTEKVAVLTSEAPSRPAEPLGTLEVSQKTNPWAPANWGSALKEILTLSLADTSYQARLNKKLVERSEKFRADQIVNVKYWPDLDSRKFPNGKVHARGEMVRYKHFEAQN